MSDIYITNESGLRTMINRWLQRREVIGPRKTPAGDVLFEPLESGTDCEFEFELQSAPPKEWLLPQVEQLFRYDAGASVAVCESPEPAEQVLFAVRPCDACGIAVLDEVMDADPADFYYRRRRRNTTCVVLACPRVFDGHFCHLLDTGPSLESGFDWQLTRLEDRFALQIGSQDGAQLAASVSDLMAPASDADCQALLESHRLARATGGEFADLHKAAERLKGRDLQSATWIDLASRCQSCGGCSFLCPSCACFNIVDVRTSGAGGHRARQWDSCAYSGFTCMAGGQNPGADKTARVHRRLYHKLACATCSRNAPACVGCGRCVEVCVGNAKLRNVLAGITSEESKP